MQTFTRTETNKVGPSSTRLTYVSNLKVLLLKSCFLLGRYGCSFIRLHVVFDIFGGTFLFKGLRCIGPFSLHC